MTLRLREQLREVAPQFFAIARGDDLPALSAVLTSDGRVGRQTINGFEWHLLLDAAEQSALLSLAKTIGQDQSSFSVRDTDGTVFSGFSDDAGRGQLRASLPPYRRLGRADWAQAIPETMFDYLQSLALLGENLWIVGDTATEYEFGAALCPEAHGVLVRAPHDRPPPFAGISLPTTCTIERAFEHRDNGHFAHLVFDGMLDARSLPLLAHRSGVLFTQRATSVERALAQAQLVQRTDLAHDLLAIGAVITLTRSRTGGAQITHIAEFRRSQNGIDYVIIAERGVTSDPQRLAPTRKPQLLQRLVEAGIENVITYFPREDADEDDDDDVVLDQETSPIPDTIEYEDDDGEYEDDDDAIIDVAHSSADQLDDSEMSDDPGWELDASHINKQGKRMAGEIDLARGELVKAPGTSTQDGLFRARPVVRTSVPLPEEPIIGKLTIDAPSRKVIIPEAPSSTQQKRTFAEIMKERHRFPPMSSNGSPTLSPPVLHEETLDDEEIGNEIRSEGDDEDIMP